MASIVSIKHLQTKKASNNHVIQVSVIRRRLNFTGSHGNGRGFFSHTGLLLTTKEKKQYILEYGVPTEIVRLYKIDDSIKYIKTFEIEGNNWTILTNEIPIKMRTPTEWKDKMTDIAMEKQYSVIKWNCHMAQENTRTAMGICVNDPYGDGSGDVIPVIKTFGKKIIKQFIKPSDLNPDLSGTKITTKIIEDNKEQYNKLVKSQLSDLIYCFAPPLSDYTKTHQEQYKQNLIDCIKSFGSETDINILLSQKKTQEEREEIIREKLCSIQFPRTFSKIPLIKEFTNTSIFDFEPTSETIGNFGFRNEQPREFSNSSSGVSVSCSGSKEEIKISLNFECIIC